MTAPLEAAPVLPPHLQAWIGRTYSTQDEITLPAVRKIAATFDLDPDGFDHGTALPPHWYSMFFTANARHSQIGPDGHPKKGEFLPPIPLPRRMFAGRRVEFPNLLQVGDQGTKKSEIVSMVPKSGRSGQLMFLTVRHTVEARGLPAVIETQELVYREAVSEASKANAPGTPAPSGSDWSEQLEIDPVLLFRYSALTWNGHRIHYDADYARSVEGYPGCVINGGLTLHLLINAALRRAPGRLRALKARLSRPLFLGRMVQLAGTAAVENRMSAWASDEHGQLAAQVELEISP